MNSPSLSLSHRVFEALLNGGAQGMVLTVLVGLTLRCLPRINAATRHAVWFVCLLLVAALPVLQFAAGRKVGNGGSFPADWRLLRGPHPTP